MLDIGNLLHPIIEMYRWIFDQSILVYGFELKIGAIFMWVLVGSIFLHYMRKWIDA